jgi:hypothetical protein
MPIAPMHARSFRDCGNALFSAADVNTAGVHAPATVAPAVAKKFLRLKFVM